MDFFWINHEMWNDINQVEEVERIEYLRRRYINRKRIDPFELYSNEEFKCKYRFTKAYARAVVDLVRENLLRDARGGALSPELQVACALRSWARHEVQDDTADLHGISQQMVSKLCKNVAEALAEKAPNFIFMPRNAQEQAEVMGKFRNIANFPTVVGAIDCTHIKIKKIGGEIGQYYINRKGYYSLNVQVICDSELRIRNIVARWRGSVHDSRIFNESLIKQRFEEGEFLGRLLGDSGYACLSFLFIPLLQTHTEKEERYNRAHIKTRNTVERCFGVWKQRFRCLLKGMTVNIDNVKTTIVALAVLHNIALTMNEPLPDEIEQPAEDGVLARNRENVNLRGNVLRQQFIEQFF